MNPRVDITEVGLDEAIASTLSLVDPKNRMRANQVGARAAQRALKGYHRKEGRKLWIIPGPTHGPGRRQSGWYKQVAAAWATNAVTADGASLVNGANFFAHKVTGGLIKAKRVRFLTIPLIPAAHGKTAKQFAEENNTKLFRIGNALFTSQRRPNRASRLTAVYALKRSVMQKPTPGALPAPAVYVGPFEVAAVDALLEKSE